MHDMVSKRAEAANLSVVIPVFNEAGNIGRLQAELAQELASYAPLWEVIWVDDASSDGTWNELQLLVEDRASVRALRLPMHCGQSTALWTGLKAVRSRTIVTLDGDGQNDPQDIPRLLQCLDEADMVVGYRRQRHDSLAKRLFTRAANAVRNRITGSRIPDSGCGLKVFRKEVIVSLIPFEGMHRFLPTLAEIGGFRVTSLVVNHRPRRHGISKYGICDRLLSPLLDCLMLRRLMRRRLRDFPVIESAGEGESARQDQAPATQ